MSTPTKGYVSGRASYRYPALGEALPPGGAKVLLLTKGGKCVTGCWSSDSRFLAWSPMPKRSDYHCPGGPVDQPLGGEVLLLTRGGVCVSGTWVNDGRFLGWTPMPARDVAKEDSLHSMSPA